MIIGRPSLFLCCIQSSRTHVGDLKCPRTLDVSTGYLPPQLLNLATMVPNAIDGLQKTTENLHGLFSDCQTLSYQGVWTWSPEKNYLIEILQFGCSHICMQGLLYNRYVGDLGSDLVRKFVCPLDSPIQLKTIQYTAYRNSAYYKMLCWHAIEQPWLKAEQKQVVDPVTSVFSDKHLCIGITGINNKWFPLLDHCCMCGSLTRQQWLITLISLMKHGYFSLATLIILKMQASKPSCELFKDR